MTLLQQATQKILALLHGESPDAIDTSALENEEERAFAERLNQLLKMIAQTHAFILPLSRGDLQIARPASDNFFASPFKELQSRLRHLTWQATQVAGGDYSQRVDFMGEFSDAFNHMVVSLQTSEETLRSKIAELEQASSHIRRLEGFLPICSNCKCIRVEGADAGAQDSWVPVEAYVMNRTDVHFSHGLCPDCVKVLYPTLNSPT